MATFTVTIQDEELAGFRRDFLITYPIPVNDRGEPLYDFDRWVHVCVINFLNRARNRGIDLEYDRQNDADYERDRGNRPPRMNAVS